MLLHGQMQEGLRDELMKSSAESGALAYPELCVAAKSEEQRQAELRRRQQHCRAEQTKSDTRPSLSTSLASQANGTKRGQGKRLTPKLARGPRECYTCGSTDHLYKDCRQHEDGTGTKTVTTQCHTSEREENHLDLLYSSESEDSSDKSAGLVTVQDKGSCPK